jgi:hypothetical protein
MIKHELVQFDTPRHTQVGHPEGTKPKLGVDTWAAKGEGHVMCYITVINKESIKIVQNDNIENVASSV